jgi:WD40 repeat protein
VDLAVNNAGTLVAIGGDMGLVQVWNLETNSVEDLLYENELHSAPVFSADGTLLVTGSDGKILVWDLGTFALRNVHEAYEQGQLMGIHFSNDESLLVSSLIKGDTKGG